MGIGPSWNFSNNYNETVAPVNSNGYVVFPPFQSNTENTFACQVGAGMGYVFGAQNKNRLSVGYRFADLGQADFGTRGTVYPYALKTGTLTSNDIYVNFTRLF